MGAACCVAGRDKIIPAISSGDHRNRISRYSPTWSFRWESRGRVAGEDASVRRFSGGHGIDSRQGGMDSKLEITYASEDGGSLDGFQRRMWSRLSDGTVGRVRNSGSDRSISRAMSTDVTSQQVKSRESSMSVLPSPAKLSLPSVPSTSSPSTPSSQAQLQHTSSTPSRQPSSFQKLLPLPPGYTTPVDKSPRSPSAAGARLPTPSWSNELKRESFGGLSDGWSVNAFPELPASSRDGGSSLDSEAMGLIPDKMCKTGGQMSATTSGGFQACSVCLKSLTERSSWSGQKIIANTELPVVAILICGHVYHADCLEVMTSGINKYDPACPVCTLGERKTLEMSEKALTVEVESSVKRDRRSRNQAIDSNASRDSAALDHLRIGGNDGKGIMKGSSSVSSSPSTRPFFRRHFSFESRGSRTSTEVSPNKRRGLFWTKSSKE